MTRFFFLFLFLPLRFYAQTPDSIIPEAKPDIFEKLAEPTETDGKVKLGGDEKVNNLLRLQIRQNQQEQTFTGFRIQILSVSSYGCDIEKLKEQRDNFEKAFPDIPAYLKYFDPDFKIRVGNYRSRLECIPDLHKIRKLYPSCYPVKSEMTLEELKRVPLQDVLMQEEKENTEEK